MASAISYEYLISLSNQPDGIPRLLPSTDPVNPGKIPPSLMPAGTSCSFKGEYADETAITTAYPVANMADFAFNNATTSFWYWNDTLKEWVNQNITEADYLTLSPLEQAVVPYTIIPAS